MVSLGDRVADLERRTSALESRSPAVGDPVEDPLRPDGDRWWLLDHLAQDSGPGWEADGVGGAVALGGRIGLPDGRRYVRQVEHPAHAVLGADLDPAAAVLAALGHPVRLRILRALLVGTTTLSELTALPDIGTSGQVNHHLRTLRAGGLIESPRRNYWTVVGDRVVVVLTVLAAVLGPEAIAARSAPSIVSTSPTEEELS